MTVLLSREDLRARGISYSAAHIWRKVQAGTFPAPVKLGANRVAWVASEIDEWIVARVAERDARPLPSLKKLREAASTSPEAA